MPLIMRTRLPPVRKQRSNSFTLVQNPVDNVDNRYSIQKYREVTNGYILTTECNQSYKTKTLHFSGTYGILYV